MRNLYALLITLLGLSCTTAMGEAVTTRAAQNEPRTPVVAGSRPYEMVGRTEGRRPAVDFEDLSGWTIECLDGAEADLIRTREQQIWGEYVGKLEYRGISDESRAVLRPPSPVRIDGTFDCVNAWIYGNLWEWAPEPGTPFLNVSILIKDSSGKEQSIHLTRIRWKEWWLAHKKLGSPMSGASFAGIEIKGMSNTESRSIFLDSIYLYKESLKPLEFDPRPARNLTLFPGQDQGLNGTGPGGLPFPTREETILPTNFVSRFTNDVRETSPGVYEFSYSAKDAEVCYVYRPAVGGMGEMTAFVDRHKACVPISSCGIQFRDDAPAAHGKLLSAGMDDGVLTCVFDFDGVEAEYRLRIWQKSMVVDFICRGGKAVGLTLGEVGEVKNPKPIVVPFLTFGANPRILCFGEKTRPLFVSQWVDWYRSNASTMYTADYLRTDCAKINGGTKYLPKTDGKRNDLYERVFVTVSPVFEETLPTIANPRTPHGEVAGERLWQESWGPQDFKKEHERSKMLRSYGIEKLTQCNHEISWRDGGESFTLRTKAAPKKGGDKALKEYVAAQKSLGWLSGLYTNYTDYAPVNEYWDEDGVQLTPEGEWRAAWPRCYALKPSRAVEWDSKLAPIIQKKFGSTAAYTDVHTAVAPWGYCDFDARVPGAGTFAATFYAYGELLLHDQRVYGPTWSEGYYHWLYAGLATGNYALTYNGMDFSKEPLNVAFDLMKIHPLECDIGMPWTGGFFKEAGWDKPERIDESIDHFIAATMAYGHIGWLVEEVHGIQRTCRSYYMLQQLQKRYALQRPVRIRYADAKGRWHSASQAIASDVINNSRLHVVYENGLQVYVNGSAGDWTIRGHDGKPVVLPSWGWYAFHESTRFVEQSALVDGHRIDSIRSPDYDYLDGRGVLTTIGDLAAQGSIAVHRNGRTVEIIDIHGNDYIGFLVDGPGTCEAYDPNGKSLGKVSVKHTADGMAWVKSDPKARRYVYRAHEGSKQESGVSVRFAKPHAVSGDEVPATVCITGKPGQVMGNVVISLGDTEITCKELVGTRVGSTGKLSKAVSVRFPKDAKPGSNVWAKVAVSTEPAHAQRMEGWALLHMVAPFDVSLTGIADGRYRVDVRNNLHGSPEPQVDISLKSGNTGIRIDKYEEKEGTVEFLPPSEMKETSDMVVVRVRQAEHVVTREFRIQAVVDHPVVWQADEDQPCDWGYAFRGQPEMPGTTGTGASFQFADIACGGRSRHGIFSHPPYQGGVGYTFGVFGPIVLPEDDCEFRTFIGLKDGGNPSDGVLFTVKVLDESGREYVVAEEFWGNREWKPISADLSAFRGRTIRLKLIADVGPDNDSASDWASWGEPRVVLKDTIMRIEVSR